MQTPVAMSCQQDHILLAFDSLTLLLLRVELGGPVRHNATPEASLFTVRELSLLSISQPVTCAALVSHRAASPAPSAARFEDVASPTASPDVALAGPPSPGKGLAFRGDSWRREAPTHCVLLRWGGVLSLLDLETGTETHLSEVRECF